MVAVGQALKFNKAVSEDGVRAFFRKIEGDNCSVSVWRDPVGILWGAKTDGMTPEQIDNLVGAKKVWHDKGDDFTFSPITWNSSRLKMQQFTYEPSKSGRRQKSRFGWERMEIGDTRLIHCRWFDLRARLCDAIIPRDLRWTFQVTRQPELESDEDARNVYWWLVKRIA